MANPTNTPLVNGVQWGWSAIKFNLFGVPVVGIMSIKYGQKQKKENLYGSGSIPIGRGYGNVEPEAEIEIYLDEWDKIIHASPNNNPLAIPPFDVQVLYGGSQFQFKQDTLRGCEFADDPVETKQGDTKISIKIPLVVGLIQHT
jgi:hypothetical protein